MQHPLAPSVQLALTLDRGLRLDIEPDLLSLLGGWAPVASASAPLVAVPPAVAHTPTPTAVPTVGSQTGGAVVRVVRHRCPRPAAPPEEPHVRHGAARCWMDDERGVAVLHGAAGGWGRVLFAQETAEVVAPAIDAEQGAGSHTAAAADLRAMCTIAVALLAGRREGVLVAASAVIAPDGAGWLLVGEASSGKSTTAAHLVTAGWGYLADEEVLLHAGGGGSAWLEGWPRALPLDGAWPYARALGSGAARARGGEPSGLARSRWRRTAPLAGIVSTELAPELPTLLTRATPDEALASLVRATPWLLADSSSTRYELGLLRSATRAPGWRLRLGRDTHGDVARLAKCMRPLEAAS